MYYNSCRADRPACSSPLKHLDIFVGEARDPEDYRGTRGGIHVEIDGLETYEQVKEMVGFVHALANSNYISATGGTK